jgi:predicted small lipoprotein YifL
MSRRHSTPLVVALSGVLVIALGGALSGCGQKGALFLPQQKKSRVPATPSNPSPDENDTPGTAPTDISPADTTPSDNSTPTSDSTPHA